MDLWILLQYTMQLQGRSQDFLLKGGQGPIVIRPTNAYRLYT